MRGVSSDGTTMFVLQTEFIFPPEFPLKPMVIQPSLLARLRALITFSLLPLVLSPIIMSSLFARASTCLSKTFK